MNRVEKVALYSFVLNLFLLIIKFLAAILSKSMAIMGDAIHSTTDTLSSLGIFLGLKFSQRKTEKFPLGLYKLENLVSLFISFAIFIAGYEILKEVFFSPPREIKNISVGFLVEGISVVSSLIISHIKLNIGKKENSQGLISDGLHSRTDALSSIIVLVGLFGNYIGFNIDRIVAVIIVGFIVKSGYEVFIESVKVLLDASIPVKDLKRIEEVVLSEKGVKSIESLIARNSGRYIFVEINIKLKSKDLDEAHKVTERIEKKIKEEIPFVDRITIHYEPVEKKKIIIGVPIKNKNGDISNHLGEAPYFAFIHVRKEDGSVERVIIEKNPIIERGVESGRGVEVAKYLIDSEIDTLILKERPKGKGPMYMLKEHGIKIYVIEEIENMYRFNFKEVVDGVVQEMV